MLIGPVAYFSELNIESDTLATLVHEVQLVIEPIMDVPPQSLKSVRAADARKAGAHNRDCQLSGSDLALDTFAIVYPRLRAMEKTAEDAANALAGPRKLSKAITKRVALAAFHQGSSLY